MFHSLMCPCVPSDPSDPESLTALAERYLVWSEVHNFAANTVAIRRRHLARFIDWCHERSVTRAREVTPAMLERYQRHLFYYRKEDGRPLRISSQSRRLTALRSWLALAGPSPLHHAQSGRRPGAAARGEAAPPPRPLAAGGRGGAGPAGHRHAGRASQPGCDGDALQHRLAAHRSPSALSLGHRSPAGCAAGAPWEDIRHPATNQTNAARLPRSERLDGRAI